MTAKHASDTPITDAALFPSAAMSASDRWAHLASVSSRLERERARLYECLRDLRKDEWRCTVDWGAREPRDAILERTDAVLSELGEGEAA